MYENDISKSLINSSNKSSVPYNIVPNLKFHLQKVYNLDSLLVRLLDHHVQRFSQREGYTRHKKYWLQLLTQNLEINPQVLTTYVL